MRSSTLRWFHLAIIGAIVIVIAVIFHDRLSIAQQNQPLLQITSPPDGTVVAPGQTVTVVVTPAAGITFSEVTILGEDPLGFSQVTTTPPFEFSLNIPPHIRAGKYLLTALVVITRGQGATSP